MSPLRLLSAALSVSIIAAAPVAVPAAAQMKIGGNGFQLIKAVKDNDAGAFNEITRQNRAQLNSAVLDYESDGETALQIAVRLDRRPFVNDLLFFGANPNKVGGNGETPLTMAVMGRNLDLTELLLRGRAQIDLGNRRGETPLIKAVLIRDLGLIQFLLSKGAKADKTDFAGRSARQYAVADSRSPAITKALTEAPKRGARPVAGPKL